MSFKNHVALVTGAQRGIGRAVAEAFAHENARVILNDVCDEEDLVKTANALSTYEGQCVAMRADVIISPSKPVKVFPFQVNPTRFLFGTLRIGC